MPAVKFKTSRGRTVSFTARANPTTKRPQSAYNRFVKKELPKQHAKGKSPQSAMRAVARLWDK